MTEDTAYCPGPYCQRQRPYIEDGEGRWCSYCKRSLVVPGPKPEEVMNETVQRVKDLEDRMVVLSDLARTGQEELASELATWKTKGEKRAVDVGQWQRGMEEQIHGLAAVVASLKAEQGVVSDNLAEWKAAVVKDIGRLSAAMKPPAPPRGKTLPRKKGKR